MPPESVVERIVSGGQTGADRGALDAAWQLGLDRGGWCPRGRRAEDGRIPLHYPLQETDSARYDVRTRRNVMESDGTLIFYRQRITGGTALTRRLALELGKPCLTVDLSLPLDLETVRYWLGRWQIRVLNVAGPRESSCPGMERAVATALVQLLQPASRQ